MTTMKNHMFTDINRQILEDILFTVCQRNEGILDMCINHLVSTLSDNEVEDWDDMISTNFWDIYEEKCEERSANPVAQDHNKPIKIAPVMLQLLEDLK